MSSAGWETLNLLAEPTRREVYLAVRGSSEPMTREDVAARVQVSRRLAAFHLDLLAEAGLLAVDYARPPGRTGPGAGRPAKRYRAVDEDVTMSVPPRRYDIAARVLARAIVEAGDGDAGDVAMRVARDEGERIGGMRRPAGRMGVATTIRAAATVLDELGYEPRAAGRQCVRLGNCPFHAVLDVSTDLVCGINRELIDGVLRGMDGHAGVTAELDGDVPADCCVTIARR